MKPGLSYRSILLPILLCAGAGAARGQSVLLPDAQKSALASKYGLEAQDDGWVHFARTVPVAEFLGDLAAQKSSLGLSSADALLAKDAPPQSVKGVVPAGPEGVVRLDQLHLGARVEGGQLSVHYDSQGNASLMHGKLVRGLPRSKPVALSERQSLDIALAQIQAKQYAWDNPEWEAQIKADTSNDAASYYPAGELIYARIDLAGASEPANYRLAYTFTVKTLEPADQRQVVVDAESGAVLRNRSIVNESWGTVNTLYDGQRGFVTMWRGFPNWNYVLKDKDRGDKIHTLRWSSSTPWWLRGEIHDQDDVWSETAATAHWATQVAWDYFFARHARNGMDNDGGKIRVEADWPEPNNAQFERSGGYDYLRIGGSGWMGAIDVVGHEFTHGVVLHTAGLDSAGEPGALNESFGDIFGVMTEGFLEGGVNNWTIGEDPGVVRSLADPNLSSGADTVGGLFWVDPAAWWNDSGGVHSNNGVQNRWFFLLANGGAGVNDIGQAFAVQGIGPDNAARIAYRNLTVYLQQLSTFADARAGAIAAARDLFGECSAQHAATINAWHAVGVGAPAGLCVGNIVPASTSFCIENQSFSRTFSVAVSPTGTTVNWSAPGGWSVTPNGNTLRLNGISNPTVGSYSIFARAGGVTRVANVQLRQCQVPCLALKGFGAEQNIRACPIEP